MRKFSGSEKAIMILVFVIAIVAIAFLTTPAVESGSRFYKTFWSLVPAVVAIALALATKEVYSSLFGGILIGGIFAADGYIDGFFPGLIASIVDDGFVSVLTSSDHVGILIFLVLLGAVGVLTLKAGGVQAFGKWALEHIKSPKMAQIATVLLGCCVFVDDYFNCLTVGSVMRPVTDKFSIARSKLAYIIDSTAAPICIIAPVSSWAAAVATISTDYTGNPYSLFIDSIQYNFYALFTLVSLFAIILLGIEFGPMKVHEENARNGDIFTSKERQFGDIKDEIVSEKGIVADLIIPLFVILIPCCVIGLIYTGGFFSGASFIDAFANCSAPYGLAYGSILSVLIMIVYFLIRKSMSFGDIMESLPRGFRNMVPAVLILVFAWTLCSMTGLLNAEDFVKEIVNANASSLTNFLPAIIMLIACGVSFATGTSWGTFGILLPIVITVFPDGGPLMVVGVSACLAGAVFGDHCSPISDTTILSSTGAQCNHLDHVATQMPYACLIGGLSFLMFIVAGFWQNILVTIIGCVLVVAVLYLIKKMQDKKAGTDGSQESAC